MRKRLDLNMLFLLFPSPRNTTQFSLLSLNPDADFNQNLLLRPHCPRKHAGIVVDPVRMPPVHAPQETKHVISAEKPIISLSFVAVVLPLPAVQIVLSLTKLHAKQPTPSSRTQLMSQKLMSTYLRLIRLPLPHPKPNSKLTTLMLKWL